MFVRSSKIFVVAPRCPVQRHVFRNVLKTSPAVTSHLEHLLHALELGTPPHGGRVRAAQQKYAPLAFVPVGQWGRRGDPPWPAHQFGAAVGCMDALSGRTDRTRPSHYPGLAHLEESQTEPRLLSCQCRWRLVLHQDRTYTCAQTQPQAKR